MKASIYSLIILISASLVSCLEDKGYTDIVDGTRSESGVVSFFGNNAGTTTFGVVTEPGLQDFVVKVNFGNTVSATKDITVTIAEDFSLVAAYNTANKTSCVPLGATDFVLPSNTVVIKAGEKDAEFTVQVKNGETFDIESRYLIPLVIKDASGYVIASNLNTAYIVFGVKNAFEASYQATGTFHHPTAGDRPINEVKYLQTIDINTVECNLGDLGGSGYRMQLKTNADNTVTITPAGATPDIDQHWGPNTYDPATKTYTLNYSYNTGAPRRVDEKLVRIE